MDEYIVKGAPPESDIDMDRVPHTEAQAVTPEENTSRTQENTPHRETRDDSQTATSPEAAEAEIKKRNVLREKMQSISGIFATVAVTAVVAVAVSFQDAPVVNVTAFDIGYDYVSYNVDVVNETGEDLVLKVSNDYQSYEKAFDSGMIQDVVPELKPDTPYTFSIQATTGMKRTYFSKSFRTTKEQTPFEPKILDVKISRSDSGHQVLMNFDISDVYGYYSQYTLVLKKDESDSGESIPISKITEAVPIDLEVYTAPSYLLTLNVISTMPADQATNNTHKTIYHAKINN